MSNSIDNRAVKLTVFLLGAALPLVGVLVWSARNRAGKKQHVEDQHMIAVEDSFPASDPPAAW